MGWYPWDQSPLGCLGVYWARVPQSHILHAWHSHLPVDGEREGGYGGLERGVSPSTHTQEGQHAHTYWHTRLHVAAFCPSWIWAASVPQPQVRDQFLILSSEADRYMGWDSVHAS